jgi:sterol desaturase/sphingolipid hydroxylase (fatty acid hydroxylase superfamily)
VLLAARRVANQFKKFSRFFEPPFTTSRRVPVSLERVASCNSWRHCNCAEEHLFTTSFNFEVVSFFVLVAMFEIWERRRPARAIDRFAELRIDVLAFVFALLVNRVSTRIWGTLTEASLVPHAVAPPLELLRGLPGATKIVLALFLGDFVIYWIHRGQHRFEPMWRTHRWHHSATALYWFSGFRTSFLHSFCYNLPQVVIPIAIFDLTPVQAGIGYSITLLIQFWEHTNVRVNIGPLAWLIISPDYHRVHHSASRYCRMNLGTTFSVWDRWFGTYVDPATVPRDEPLGLGEPVSLKHLPRMLVGV